VTFTQTASVTAPLRALSGASRTEVAARRRPAAAPDLEFLVGDLTREVSDAIVNPAGPGLVDLAIRRAAGPELLEAFHRGAVDLPGHRLSPGRAFATPGFDLPAAHVIHCGPPVYADDPVKAAEILAACHLESLRLARKLGFTSVSFPAIGTGVYRYPVRQAAEIAIRTVVAELAGHRAPLAVRFVLRDPAMRDLYFEAARSA